LTDGRALARQYLEQQRLLGGDAVILTEKPGNVVSVPVDTFPVSRVPRTESPAQSDSPPSGISFDPPSADLFATDPIQQAGSLADVATLVAACRKCGLCDARTNTVPGEGPTTARLVVVGEGPGRTEDETGRPFVGRAGELLTKILAAIDLPREQVFICNVVKCRPPENRLPQYDEIAACVPYLYRQIELVKPKVILAMGGTAAQTLLNTKQSLGSLRNQIHRFRGIPLLVTYHPAALLRNPNWKRPTWDDVRIAARLLAD
jgi:DNA polymerase